MKEAFFKLKNIIKFFFQNSHDSEDKKLKKSFHRVKMQKKEKTRENKGC